MNICIITAQNGVDWYPKKQNKLITSLKEYYDGDILRYTTWPNNNYNTNNPYNIKAATFEEAIKENYDILLWLDCSMYAIKPLNEIFEWISEKGFYSPINGFNVCQETSDKCLNYFNVKRDDAEKMKQCSSGIIGVDMRSFTGKEFVNRWIKSAKDGAFDGSRDHDNQSTDPRFLRHRQDQSCASILIYELGLEGCLDITNKYFEYYFPNKSPKDTTIFMTQGG